MKKTSLALAISALVSPHAAWAQTSGNNTQLEEIEIRSFQREYKAPSTTTALGFEADPMSTPLTTLSIPMDILEDQQVNNVEDALRNVAGVTKFKQGNGGEEKFSIRGFDASQSLYKDGARINNVFNATNIATTETANIERYDVLKGPAAILYGQGEPGGVINYITKKPLFKAHRSAEVIAGSDDYYRAEADLTGPLGESFAYRLVLSSEDSGSHRDFTARDRQLLAPSLTWKVSPQTLLTAQYEYITDAYTQDRGQVLDGDNVSGYNYSGRLNGRQFFGIPGWNENT
ncbi:MAG TPA: TonB-dependent receptor plug domain-containing protein, partial [Limnobacter sp.]|nr:TonB-dependent receptor plug domain-containing protein [Limnobacter sp.]